MIIEIILLLSSLFVSFFLLFIFSKQDFVLLRQNISLAQIFDLAGLIFIPAFVVGRFFSIVDSFNFSLLNILKFFHLLKFPGVSPLGFLIGGVLGIWLLFRNKKGLGRIYDIFSISFFPLYVFFILNQAMSVKFILVLIPTFVVLVLLFYFFVKSHNKYILRDGSVSLIFTLVVSAATIIFNYFSESAKIIFFHITPLQVVSVVVIIVSLFVLFLNQRKTAK